MQTRRLQVDSHGLFKRMFHHAAQEHTGEDSGKTPEASGVGRETLAVQQQRATLLRCANLKPQLGRGVSLNTQLTPKLALHG